MLNIAMTINMHELTIHYLSINAPVHHRNFEVVTTAASACSNIFEDEEI